MRYLDGPWAGLCFDSNSSSSNETQNTTENQDRRVAAQDNAIVVQLDQGAALNLTDPQAIEGAKAALGAFERVLNDAFGFAQAQGDKAFGLAGDVLSKNRTEAAQALDNVIKAGVTIAVVATGAWAVSKFAKGKL